jgi:hypothetical protein
MLGLLARALVDRRTNLQTVRFRLALLAPLTAAAGGLRR